MIGLGIETTCDETSLSIVKNGTEVLGLKIFSQIDLHSKFRGIVPEIASRSHLEKINFLLDEVLEEAQLSLEDLNYIAVANRPGLIGSILIGMQMAKCLSFALRIPMIAVDHLEAHLNSVQLENKAICFPYLGVLLSGGNSAIFLVEGYGSLKLIGNTIDDALGEAFDKVAILLGLGYPGGPVIEKIAKSYIPSNKEKSVLPKLLKYAGSQVLFSYSGLKTSVLYYTQKHVEWKQDIPKLAYYFQESAFELVERNIKNAVQLTGVKNVVAGGGVLANSTLQNKLDNLAQKENYYLQYPKKKILCTDNGAMIACLGYNFISRGTNSPLEIRSYPSVSYPSYTIGKEVYL
jgi:N6-L-threonylcarbamoyladenine synthase